MNTQSDSTFRPQNEADPATLEREIDRQRDHINELVNALTSKLGGNLPTGDLMNQLGSTMKANPLPSLVTLAGLAWLYASREKPVEQRRHVHVGPEGMGATTGSASLGASGTFSPQPATYSPQPSTYTGYSTGQVDGASGSGAGAGGRMQNLKQGASQKLGSAKDATRQRAQKATESYQHLLENNPLAAGAIGIAVGALLGALLPATHKEDEMLGQTSSKLKQGAKDLARTGYEKAAEAGREVTSKPAGDGMGQRPTSTIGPAPIQGQPS